MSMRTWVCILSTHISKWAQLHVSICAGVEVTGEPTELIP